MVPGFKEAGMREVTPEKEGNLSGVKALMERLNREGDRRSDSGEGPRSGVEALIERLNREEESGSKSSDGGDTAEKGMPDGGETDLPDSVFAELNEILSSPEKLQELLDQHPEIGKKIADEVNILNDPEASDLEVERAKRKLDSNYKGEVLEVAVKDILAQLGLDVEDKQKLVEGESGRTKPDVIAYNNTDRPINVFGIVIRPGETLGVECKCGRKEYLSDELKNHIPNQLSGHEGHSMLLTTSNIKDVNPELVNSVCSKYGTTLVMLDVSATGVENAMKGARA